MNPTIEDAYWRENFLKRNYFIMGMTYEHYQPAYRLGWTSYSRHAGKKWNEIEPTLMSEWLETKPLIEWKEAKPAARDAWERLDKANRI